MRTSGVLFLLAASAFFAVAQDDPPDRVGRLSYISGQVSFRPGDVDDWVPADINRPLTTGDHLWTDEGARAELHVGAAALRLNSRAAFEFLNLDDALVQIRLTEGSLVIRLRSLGNQESFEVDTPNLAFSLLRAGEYRIDVNPDRQTTTVTVRAGEGEVTGSGQAFTVHAREQAEVSSGGDALSYNILGVPPPDDWDNWCLARDRREDQSASARYVSREMVGYQDLDDNGDWRTVPEYGAVWAPRTVAAGWAPYRYGHWVWVEPWGWTWVDDAPWGFAPFHYGRWVYVGYWAWVPGPIAVRPVYAPALVAWVGGPRFSVAVSFGGGVAGVGWFPLGPREVYVPVHRASNAYVQRVNVTNTTIVNNINITNVYNTTNVTYVNRNAPGAVTAVPQNTFGTTRRVQDAAVPVQRQALDSAQVINGAPVAPTRQNVLGNYSPTARVAQPPAAVQNRAVVARTPPPPPPVPFAQRQQALSTNPGRPLDAAQVQQLRSTQPPPVRTYIRPAQAVGNPASVQQPGQVQGPPRDERRPQNVQRESPPQQQPNNVPPPRFQRDVQQTQQQRESPTVRPLERPAEPPQQPNNVPRPRVQREVQQQPPQRESPPVRPLEERRPQPPPQPPPQRQNDVPPQRVQQQQQRESPPVRPVERPVEPLRPPQREVQQTRPAEPPRQPERQPQKEEKKDDKKDEPKKKQL